MTMTIEEEVIEYAKKYIGEDFVFRENQLDVIVGIIEECLELSEKGAKANLAIAAPTGSGKSWIIMLSAGVLWKYHHKTSYILCSEIFLWEQYLKDIKKYNFADIGFMRGNFNTLYNCKEFACKCTEAMCSIQHKGVRRLKAQPRGITREGLQYDCTGCQYVEDKIRAMDSPITLLTYQLFLWELNIVYGKNGIEVFKPRDFIFCDECHKIPDVCQSFFETVVSMRSLKFLVTINEYAHKNVSSTLLPINARIQEIVKMYDNLGDFKTSDDKQKVFDALCDLIDMMIPLCDEDNGALPKYFEETFGKSMNPDDIKKNSMLTESKHMSKEDNEAYNAVNDWRLYHDRLNNLSDAIKNENIDNLTIDTTTYKTIEGVFGYVEHKEYSIKFAKDSYICPEVLFQWANVASVMTSATIGEVNSFINGIGLSEYKYVEIPDHFTYNNCPVIFFPDMKFTYKNKDAALELALKRIEKILTLHPNHRGVIHTVSFFNAKYIMDHINPELKNRLLMYDNAEEKNLIIQTLSRPGNEDKVLIGPSLFEGLNLYDDLCRFQVVMKMPYPYLNSDFIKKKCELYPTWYINETGRRLIQSLGRGIRSKDDWCWTYILDACFTNVASDPNAAIPDTIKNRVVMANKR